MRLRRSQWVGVIGAGVLSIALLALLHERRAGRISPATLDLLGMLVLLPLSVFFGVAVGLQYITLSWWLGAPFRALLHRTARRPRACDVQQPGPSATPAKRTTVEQQLTAFAESGLRQNAGTRQDDLFAFAGREEMEQKPYRLLAEALGREIEREPWTPICDRLWMCDLERIEDHGAYAAVLLRLERMTASALGATDVTDYVDVDEGVAWVQFAARGARIRWDLKVDDDWLDPAILQHYDALVAKSGSRLRIYGAAEGYGQVAFLAAFTPEHRRTFMELTGIEMAPVR